MEEEVIKKGSPLSAELCRVLVALAQIAGLPARIVFLFAAEDGGPEPPPSFATGKGSASERHAVCEIYAAGQWAVFDPVSDRSFAWAKHGYASAWDLRRMPRLIDGLQDHGRLRYVDSRYYRSAAIAGYDPWDLSLRYPWDRLDAATASRLQAGAAS